MESTGGTHGRAGTTLKTFVFIPLDVFSNAFHLDPEAFQIPKPFSKILPVAAHFDNRHPLFSRVDGRLQNIAAQLELSYEIGDDRFIDRRWREPERKHFGVTHDRTPEILNLKADCFA
jgi:hypothetical protein